MRPKTINILYWVFTILFAALMIFSSWGALTGNPEAKKLIHDQLGYPVYFIAFNAVTKLIGSIILLIPGLYVIKEWAYAGLFFDLVAVVYSSIAVAGGHADPMIAFMLVWFIPGILSYYYWKKKLKVSMK